VCYISVVFLTHSALYGPIFAIYTPYESALHADNESVAYFPICQGTLPWQPNNVAKMLSTLTDTTCICCTRARKLIEILRSSCAHYSANDACISCENFVKFGPVTPYSWQSSFVNVRYHVAKKTGVFCRISLDILDRFSQSFHHMRVLRVQMINWNIFFEWQGTLPWQPYNVAIMKANWYYVQNGFVSLLFARGATLQRRTQARNQL